MKEHPIIFSTDMVKAILDGRKTMTRRVIKPQPLDSYLPDSDLIRRLKAIPQHTIKLLDKDDPTFIHIIPKCPYGQVGSGLWVRETLYRHPYLDEAGYIADETPVFINQTIGDVAKWQWRKDILPSIFMPRWASRIILKITEVRVEKLNCITASDCEKEGIDGRNMLDPYIKNDFKVLWDSLIAKRGYGWEANCWVWVISFKVL